MAEPTKIHKVNVPFSKSELESLKATALAAGYASVEEYIRGLVVTALPESYQTPPLEEPLYQPVYTTRSGLGQVYQGDSAEVLRQFDDESVDLIMTSPPFGLVRKKDYGNEDADEYVRWFKPFAREFKRILKPTGSLVIDIGGGMEEGPAGQKPVSVRTADLVGQRIRILPSPRILLVESCPAAHSRRMGNCPAHSSQGRCEHHLVACQNPLPESLEQAGPTAL